MITKEDLPDKLINFLISKNALDQFLYNIQHYPSHPDSFYKYSLELDLDEAINFAFIWGNAKEESGFWTRLNAEWKQTLTFYQRTNVKTSNL